MQATPQSLYWECSTCSTTSGLCLDGCDVRLVDREGFEGVDANMVPIGDDETPCLKKVQGQLKGVDQEVYLLLIYETGQRPEHQITTLGLVSRQQVESGEQVTNIPEGFFNCVVLDSQRTESFPRQVRLVIERNIDEMCPKRNPQSRMQHENLDVRGVGTTRPLRGVALFNETCELTDEDAQEATVRACHSVNPGIIIIGIPRRASKSHFEFRMMLCT